MTAPDPQTFTAEELARPETSAQTLAAAAARPDLWSVILTHPNCYPALAGWIRAQPGAPAVAARAQTVPQSQQPLPQRPGPQNQTTATGFHDPQAGGAGQRPSPQSPDRYQQPGSQNQYQQPGQAQWQNQYQQPFGPGTTPRSFLAQVGWPRVALAGVTLLALVSLTMPIVTVGFGGFYHQSFSYIDVGSGDGVIVLLVMLLVLGANVMSVFLRQPWAAPAAGGIGIGGGTLGTLVAFVAMSKIGDVTSSTGGFGTASVGFGLVLLLLSSLAVIAFGILTIVLRRR